MLIMKADAAYPGKFDFRYNLEKVLQETVPAGKGWYAENQAEKPIEGGENALWRKGSFEVMNMNTGEVLYSKLVRSGRGSGRGKRRTHNPRTVMRLSGGTDRQSFYLKSEKKKNGRIDLKPRG